MDRNTEASPDSFKAIDPRRVFVVGQVWLTRLPEDRTSRAGDRWRIEAITDHPTSPVIARHACGAIRAFGLDGHMDGEPDRSGLDLDLLVETV